ncbi:MULTISPECIES: hypothetical protein [unclassified Streptomyces]|uniref:hypothetical protein n=1 Tax=unclassified Streptomyces TaxID=2593676 RepID=UPI00278C7948|nr:MULTISPECIES: hypothetical protein [unclassified Streptomyces]
MNALPEPRPTTPMAGQRSVSPETQKILDDIERIYSKPVPKVVHAPVEGPRVSPPPAPQPGRTPMSQRATDLSGLMLAGGASGFMLGTPVAGILWASGYANPTVIAIVFGAPTALALAISRVIRRANQHAEAGRDIHQHFHGDVHQDHSQTETKTYGIFATTNNAKEKK